MISCGIVGLPNAGKSTLFNALTGASVLTAPFPFSTRDPSEGIFFMPDEALPLLQKYYNSKKITYPSVKVIDIAGLIKDAHRGEGLGNIFLSHIGAVDLILHVVGAYDVVHENVEPIKKNLRERWEIVMHELAFHDFDILERHSRKVENKARTGDRLAIETAGFFREYRGYLESGDFLKVPYPEYWKWQSIIKQWELLAGRPQVIIVNAGEDYSDVDTKSITEIFDGWEVVVCNAALMEECRGMGYDEIREIYGGESFPQMEIAQAIKKAGDLICYYTCNENEARGRLIRRGATAIEAAEQVHTDIARHFIKAEVINWKELLNGGRPLLSGKEYIIREGDVVLFRFGK